MSFRVKGKKRQHLQQFWDDPSNRRLINILRVRYWYAGVKQKTGLSTAYQLECYFEPLTKASIDKRTPFRNKWSRYQSDKHKPGTALADLVEAKVPGSARELNHPLWEVLRLGERALPKIDSWMEKLEPRVLTVVYHPPKDQMNFLKIRQPYTHRLGSKLVKLGNLDALSALLLYWLESKRLGENKDTQCQASSIYQLLLMMGMDFRRRNIAEELFVLFLVRVFTATDWGDRQFGINPAHYKRAAELLYGLLYEIRDINPFSSWAVQCKTMYQLLSGKKGSDVAYGLNLVLMPNWQFGPPTEQQWKSWTYDFRLAHWGWIHLNRGTHGRLPDDELWESLNKVTDAH